MVLQLAVGLALGALFILYARKGRGRESLVFAVGLVVAAVVYVGFALANGAPVRSLLLESLGVVPFGLLAWLVVSTSFDLLLAGYIAGRSRG